MSKYIDRSVAIARLTELEVTEPNATMADAKRVLADMPCAEAVSLHDIYRVIAGHSYYHGDRILAALTCIAEGKEVNPVLPTDLVPVVRCKDCEYSYDEISYLCCSHGVCVDCEVPPNFYCAYGKRRSENEPPEEGET